MDYVGNIYKVTKAGSERARRSPGWTKLKAGSLVKVQSRHQDYGTSFYFKALLESENDGDAPSLFMGDDKDLAPDGPASDGARYVEKL
jgi:hypothetical protein